jgi:DNA-binding transcriptional LysR family regulator
VAAPFDFNRHLRDLLTRFMKAYPAIEFDLRLSNRTLDMVDEGIDVYLRITNSIDAGLIARPLAITTLGLFGARDYFRKHRRPRAPSDLTQHRFALFNEPPVLDEWTLERRGKRTKVRLRPAIVANSGELAMAAVSGGLAMGVVPSFLLPPEQADVLEPVMLEWSIGRRGIYAVYPHRRFVPSKVRAFVDFLRAALGNGSRDPWWPPSIPHPGTGRGPVELPDLNAREPPPGGDRPRRRRSRLR